MSRTIRSERSANELQATRAHTTQSIRAEWRKVLERRDARHNNIRTLHNSMARQHRQMGSARVFLLTLIGAIASAVISVMHSV